VLNALLVAVLLCLALIILITKALDRSEWKRLIDCHVGKTKVLIYLKSSWCGRSIDYFCKCVCLFAIICLVRLLPVTSDYNQHTAAVHTICKYNSNKTNYYVLLMYVCLSVNFAVHWYHSNPDVRGLGGYLTGNGFQVEETCWREICEPV